MRKHHISFKHAFDGLVWIFTSQPNFRIHTFSAALVLLVSYLLKLQKFEVITLSFTIMLVIVAEMLNTAVEAMTDLITTEHHQQAKIAKDVSAGMVLLTAIFSVLIGVVIIGPHLINLAN